MEHEHAASLTARAVKKALTERAIVTKDARTTLNSATSMFTLYLTAAAQDNSARHKRQTITLSDVLQALKDVDLEHFTGPIEDCLAEAKEVAAKKKARKEAEIDHGVEAIGEEELLVEAAATDEDVVEEEDEAMESAEEEPQLQEEASAAMSDRETATEDEEEKIELEEDRIDEDPVADADDALE